MTRTTGSKPARARKRAAGRGKTAKSAEDLHSLLEIAAAMNSEKDITSLLDLIVEKTTSVLDAERTTLYLYDPDTGELSSFIAQGQDVGRIVLKPGQGLAGHVAAAKKPLRIDDPYSDPRFNREVDRKTGFRTRSMLLMPLLNLREDVIGVMQVMNKKGGRAFSEKDAELLMALSTQAAVAVEKQSLYEENERFFNSIIRVLAAAMDARDPVTAGHSERVARYSMRLARALGYGGDSMKLIRYAATLHDVGKIGVSDGVLKKAGRLDAAETEEMRSHAKHTREILSKAEFPRALRGIPGLAGSHHEKLDGSGYPDRAAGKGIGVMSRIMAVADVYDALTACDRPYKPAIRREKAFEMLREEAAAGRLDKDIVEKFIGERLYEPA